METKDFIIIGLVIMIAIIGIAFAVTNLDLNFGEDETKTQDFEVFTMNVTNDLEFNRSVDDSVGMVSFRGNNSDGDYIKVSYMNKTGLAGLMLPGIIDSLLRGITPLDVNDKLTIPFSVASVAFYEMTDENTNETYYTCIIENDDVVIIVNNYNLDELIKMVNTITFKNIPLEEKVDTTPTTNSEPIKDSVTDPEDIYLSTKELQAKYPNMDDNELAVRFGERGPGGVSYDGKVHPEQEYREGMIYKE